jgi:SNF2 family DNA or RNA helicase
MSISSNIQELFPFKLATEPMKHQVTAWQEMTERSFYALFMEMGTGKTKVIIDDIAFQWISGLIDGVIIFAPKGLYRNWEPEIQLHMSPEVNYRMYTYSASQKNRKHIDALTQITQRPVDGTLDILNINIESVITQGGKTSILDFMNNHNVYAVIDESTSIKNPKAKKTKFMMAISRGFEFKRIMSGTPMTHGPMDLFSQCEFLKRGLLGFASYTSYRAYYARLETVILGTRRFQQIVGYQNLDVLGKDIQKFSYRVTKKECLDLPEKIYEQVVVEHTPEQARIYNQLKDEFLLEFDQGEITVTNALTMIIRLQQINEGYLPLDDGQGIREFPSRRAETIIDMIKEFGIQKALVWCAFQYDVEFLAERLKDADIGYVTYYGKTSDRDRQKAIESFKNDPKVTLFIGTPDTGGKGLTLTEANYVFYMSRGYNLEHRLQSEDRAHRIGQKNNVTYIDLVTPGTVDERILENLKAKKDVAKFVIDDIRDLLL